MARRTVLVLLSLLGTILLGTTVLLGSISIFLRIRPEAYITEDEVPWPDPPLTNASYDPQPGERIPRILHQTWKDETLPEKWAGVSQGCRDLMPDYEYMLWTDDSSREFIKEHYPWFLPTFDGYPYVIQRADAIRYFVLYHYGGTYLDLDVGCLRRLDPLLTFPAILPRTKPVGLSNDLMFASPRHPFFRKAIDSLQSFDHNWLMNYPTVMFSTGPMFISAVYGLYTSATGYPRTPEEAVRVLPKPLYGKNAAPGEAPHAFFTHYYGSSWHADDAGLVLFLGTYGTLIMYVALFILVAGAARLLYLRLRQKHRAGLSLPHSPGGGVGGGRWRRLGRYDVLLPRIYTDSTGRHRLELGGATFSLPSSPRGSGSTATSSPYGSRAPSPSYSPANSEPILPLSALDTDTSHITPPAIVAEPTSPSALQWAASLPSRLYAALPTSPSTGKPHGKRRHGPGRRGMLFLLPAVLRPRGHASSRGRDEAEEEDIGVEYDAVPLTGRSDVPLLGRERDDGRREPSPPPYPFEARVSREEERGLLEREHKGR